MQSSSLATGLCVCVRLLLALHRIPVMGGILAAGDTAVVDTLEVAPVALQSRIVAAHADHTVSHALLLVAVQVVVLLLVVRMAAPGCSSFSPSFRTWLSQAVISITKSIPTRSRLTGTSQCIKHDRPSTWNTVILHRHQ
jgi:hypothetical protein